MIGDRKEEEDREKMLADPQKLTIIIHVSRKTGHPGQCVASVIRHATLSEDCHLLILVDGGMEAELDGIYSNTPISRFISVAKNAHAPMRGLNSAIGLRPDDDILLLSGDCRVTSGWLTNLRRHAASGPDVATVSPLSNNAGAYSMPDSLPEDIEGDEIAKMLAECAPGASLVGPGGNGVCLYLRREALRAIGFFDEKTFPEGYCADNDLCMRAYYAGLRNLVALDTYIWREAGENAPMPPAQARALDRLQALYPDYFRLLKSMRTSPKFLAAQACLREKLAALGKSGPKPDTINRIAEYWRLIRGNARRNGILHVCKKIALNLGRILRSGRDGRQMLEARARDFAAAQALDLPCERDGKTPVELADLQDAANREAITEILKGAAGLEILIDHNWGGGANAYSRKRIQDALASVKAVLQLAHAVDKPFVYAIFHAPGARLVFRIARLDDALDPDWIRPEKIFVNNLVTWCGQEYGSNQLLALQGLTAKLAEYAQKRSIPLEMPLHDYHCLCPNYNLVGQGGIYCGLPDPAICSGCLARRGKSLDFDIREWRQVFGGFLGKMAKITCFSQASSDLVGQGLPQIAAKIAIRPHQALARFTKKHVPPQNGPMVVAIIGQLVEAKGLNIAKRLATLLKDDEKLVIIGECECFAPYDPQIIFHGAYQREALPDILAQYGVTVGLVPSVWPETFCYVAQECMQVDLPLVTFDLGAQGERTRAYANGLVAFEMTAESALAALRELDLRRKRQSAPKMEASKEQ